LLRYAHIVFNTIMTLPDSNKSYRCVIIVLKTIWA